MMKHECTPIAMADWADEICSICRASLTLPSYNNLVEAIERVRKWHYKATSMFHVEDVEICATCSSICPHEVDSDVYWPCDTIRALDNIGIWFRSEALDGEQ